MISTKQLLPFMLLSLAAALLSACGGGGAGAVSNGFASTNNTKPQTSSADSSAISSAPVSSAKSSSSKAAAGVSSSAAPKPNSSSPTIDTLAPTMVSEIAIAFTSYDIAVFSWAAATDNVGVTAYKIYRNQIQIDQIDAANLSYADFNVAPDRGYTYGVSAGDAVGNWSPIKTVLGKTQPQPIPPNSTNSSIPKSSSSSSYSSLPSASSKSSSSLSNSSSSSRPLDTMPPSAPTHLFEVSATGTQVNIGWGAASDNVAVTTYNIYRDNILLGSVAHNILMYTDNTVQANKSYTYSVETGDAAGNKSLARKSIVITTPPEATKGDATLYWAPPTQREDGSSITGAELGGFLIRYKLKTATDYIVIDINDNSAKSRVITNLTGDYEFQIAAYDSNNLYSSFVNLSPH